MGPEAYGEVFYLGQLPDERQKMQDVLVGRFDTLETRFMFDPETGRLAGLECWSEPENDPCEIEFADFRPVGGVELPHRLLIRSGDFFEWRLEVSSFDLTDGS